MRWWTTKNDGESSECMALATGFLLGHMHRPSMPQNADPNAAHTLFHNRTLTPTHGKVHSLFPSRHRNHWTPIPVLYGTISSMPVDDLMIFRFAPSITAPANVATVLFVMSPRKLAMVEFPSLVQESGVTLCEYMRGKNQPVYPSPPSSTGNRLKSTKQRPDQWHELAKSMTSRNEQ